ncbi:ATP-binding protein [Streptomyces sp. NPDC007088]|uniref:ATP-binding protein n=1 Tax=Streptomyces sp. NPDC007088 TaxID=3364773 RepID=UPI00368CEBBB
MAGVVNRRCTLEVEATEERLSQVRRIAAAHLRYWGLDLQVAPVCRAVEELLRNVAAHARGDKRSVVEIRWSGRQLTVSVADRDHRLPRLLTSHKGGLGRVAALSDSWGTCATAEGKVIWFTRLVKDAQRIPAPGGLPTRTAPAVEPLPTLPAPHEVPAPAERPGEPLTTDRTAAATSAAEDTPALSAAQGR